MKVVKPSAIPSSAMCQMITVGKMLREAWRKNDASCVKWRKKCTKTIRWETYSTSKRMSWWTPSLSSKWSQYHADKVVTTRWLRWWSIDPPNCTTLMSHLWLTMTQIRRMACWSNPALSVTWMISKWAVPSQPAIKWRSRLTVITDSVSIVARRCSDSTSRTVL